MQVDGGFAFKCLYKSLPLGKTSVPNHIWGWMVQLIVLACVFLQTALESGHTAGPVVAVPVEVVKRVFWGFFLFWEASQTCWMDVIFLQPESLLKEGQHARHYIWFLLIAKSYKGEWKVPDISLHRQWQLLKACMPVKGEFLWVQGLLLAFLLPKYL